MLALLQTFGAATTAFAQTGRIAGTIVDGATGEPLFSASVLVVETSGGAVADFDGNYLIKGLQPGSYTLRVSYISYATQTITDVKVLAGQVTTIDVVLEPESATLEEIVVAADAILDNDAALLRQRQKSIAFADAISAQSISRFGSGDAADAMRKVVGASVIGGKYVFVRGLGDRYSSTQLNGSVLPSADPDKQSFQMDIIPSNLLENIVTLKTFTPDKPGSFSGGLVNIVTKDFPEKLSMQVSASTSYNSETSLNPVLLPGRYGTDWLGFDDGSRDRPAILAQGVEIPDFNGVKFERDAGKQAQDAQLLQDITTAFRGEMLPSTREVPVDQSYSFSVGNQTELFGKVLGFTGSLRYSRSYSSYSGGVLGRWQLIGALDDSDLLNPIKNLTDEKGTEEVDLNGYGMVSLKLNEANMISATFLQTKSATNTGRYLHGFDDEVNGRSPDGVYESRALHYTERTLGAYQLRGRHVLRPFNNAELEWSASSSRNTQSEPDLRYLVDFYVPQDDGTNFYSITSALFPRPSRAWRDLEEDNLNASADLTIPFRSFDNMSGQVKIGGFLSRNDRVFRENRYQYDFDNNAPLRLNDFASFDDFFNYAGIVDTTTYGSRTILTFGNVIQNALSLKNNYDAESQIDAAYAMIEFPLGGALKFVGGARLESATIRTASLDTTLPQGVLDNQDVLPSASLIYSLGENMNLRVAYTHTVARPNYRELAPYQTVGFQGDFVFEGRADLQRSLIRNLDMRWEWFTGTGEVFAVSAFGKRIENPIEKVYDVRSARKMRMQNVEEGEVYGVEFEARKNLGFLSAALRDVAIASNLTFVRSSVRIPEEEMFINLQNDPDAEDTRPLNGQSPYVFNLDLSYQNPRHEWNVDLGYNVFGERLVAVALGAAPDVFERPFQSLNLTTSKRIAGRVQVKFTAKNLLDSTVKMSQMLSNGNEFINESYKPGRTLSLGVSYTL